MDAPALEVENIGKKYQIGKLAPGFRTLREAITDAAKRPVKRTWSLLRGSAYGAAQLEEEIWALKEVSFKVGQGEVVGVIGRNGAGKSTLLRVLTRITEPTEGLARIRGRVGALLEVGTGLHHELTGRENIYLNGSILGMKRAEVNRKFDEMVDFAGIEQFLETPIKHYSDGMRVRLAFSVAAHLDPEILFVDEVLSVGDVAFQRKCVGKMGEVVGEGRTILFVSHNITAVRELCPRSILLDRGNLVFDGPTDETITRYLSDEVLSDGTQPDLRSGIWIIREYFRGVEQAGEGLVLDRGEPITCGVEIQTERVPDRAWLNLEVFSIGGVRLVDMRSDYDNVELDLKPGGTTMEVGIDELPLLPGTYSIRFRLLFDYGGQVRADAGREFPLLIRSTKEGEGKEQAFVYASHSWRRL
ncbi:MAG: ABC transporter ATP-binding protein [Actinobacteria bacterium]|nr:ABC transporter ATP-binding protein [Actinomycetota bacterium]MCG2819203.1 ABC transporter ATP-binding protein [Actinomycetes bacterium]MBU4218830.1 ABC transporter ATP-binding protein [Actinomycetota bacterium]MBU4360170.1 ABC transporter ATP-binding protein [Actinomycetota bacterium]MBU4391075.1 ABC transporter ATP-binding protein [Actinomycetota bacterium]